MMVDRLQQLRRFVNRRYVRAALSGISIVLIVLGFGACAVKLQHDVSYRAVLRYFARPHFQEADLTDLVRNPATTRSIEELFSSPFGVNPGGLVYVRDGALVFYPHATERALSTKEEQRFKEEFFPRLAQAYHRRDFGALLEALSEDQAQKHLRRAGIGPQSLTALEQESQSAASMSERLSLLRRSAQMMRVFVPYHKERYELSFADKLAFYDQNDPPGEFVGMFEVVDLQIGGEAYDAGAYQLGERNHFISIRRGLGRIIVLSDYFQGRVEVLTIKPFSHPSGQTLYRVFEGSPPQPGSHLRHS
ncbi:MAG: hypothetical protein EP299_05190 [Acidobacteria bacterium]|nr:MAG: hypothetical protein EP299_05190 [Acidobacteriota bacterium]